MVLLREHVFKFAKGIFDVSIHRTDDLPFFVVKFQDDADILVLIHFEFDGIMSFNGIA